MAKVAAIVVTYNRIELLKKVVNGLRKQTRLPDAIIIINNSSTDGTIDWLSEQSDLTVITQDNLGSSGGQYAGAKYAYENNFDYIWLMDDDVVANPNCLEILLNGIDNFDLLVPLRYNNNEPYLNDVIELNITNPLKSIWKKIITEDNLTNDYIEIEGFTFEGPLFHRNLIEKIGLPEKGFFIYADDTEFSVRAKKAGLKAAISTKARLDRMIPPASDKGSFTWKHYYLIRNLIAIDRLHCNFLVRNLRPFGYLLTWLKNSNSKSDRTTVLKAFKDGWFYRKEV